MKYRALDYLVCPGCNSELSLSEHSSKSLELELNNGCKPCQRRCAYAEAAAKGAFVFCRECLKREIEQGKLLCVECGRSYLITEGIPQFVDQRHLDKKTTRTQKGFGFLWSIAWYKHSGCKRWEKVHRDTAESHLHKLIKHLPFDPEPGLWFDAGCGNGNELVVANNLFGDIEIIGVDVSYPGVRNAYQRTQNFPLTHIMQADLRQLPLRQELFDFVFSYGVLHHLAQPDAGLRSLNRTLKKGKTLSVYLYEDFKNRSCIEKLLLKSINSLRALTVILPHRMLYFFCLLAAPLTYIFLTIPAKVLSGFRRTRAIAKRIPYHHTSSLFDATTDLFDRFAAPVEHRYNPERISRLFEAAGVDQPLGCVRERGWVVWAKKS